MWPLKPISHTFVGITITSQHLTCTWVANSVLKTYEQHPFHNYEVMQGVLYNPSALQSMIRAFLHAHNLANAYAVIALEDCGNYTAEQIMQYQLLALAVPLHCIMITVSPENDDRAAHAISLYNLGKQIYENAR